MLDFSHLLVTNVTLKMLCLLMLNENLFVVKLTITIPNEEKSQVISMHGVGDLRFFASSPNFGCITDKECEKSSSVDKNLPAPWLLCLK